MLDYKLAWKGKKLVKIDRFFPSSKKCSKCGKIKKELGDLYKRVNGTFPKISTQSLRIIKLLHRKQGKIFTKSNEYYVRKISCAWGMPGFRIHSFQDYRRKIEMGITVGVQVPRIIPL